MLKYLPFSRDTYHKDRKTAAIVQKIEDGEDLVPENTMTLDAASWIATKGEGQGQRQFT